jgi:sugar O-acyltransferase (sialic acid O-acetyltransferase NeuD family)
MPRPLVLLGASGNALDVLDVVDALNASAPTWEVLGVLDDGRPRGHIWNGLTVLGPLSDLHRLDGCWFINTIGSDQSFRLRPQLVANTGLPPERFATLIHPRAAVSPHAQVGCGVLIQAGAVVAGNVTLDDHVAVGPGCLIGHDSVIGPHALLAPGAIISGFCQLGTACYIGAGAMLRQRVQVGAGALVGMGAVVLHEVADAATVIGNPAHPLRNHEAIREELLPARG